MYINTSMARLNGTQTSVGIARSSSGSLRTTIPIFVVSHLGLNAKDRLDWKVDKINGEWVAIIRKI